MKTIVIASDRRERSNRKKDCFVVPRSGTPRNDKVFPITMQVTSLDIKEVGVIEEVKRGIIRISGLPNCLLAKSLRFPGLKGW